MTAIYRSRSDLLIAQEVASLLSDPAGPYKLGLRIKKILAAQSSEDTGRPLLTVSGSTMDHFGAVTRRGELQLELRSRSGDENGQAIHQQNFDAIFGALLGFPGTSEINSSALRSAAKTAFKSAIAARGAVSINDYGPTSQTIEEEVEGDDLRSTLKLGIIWAFQ